MLLPSDRHNQSLRPSLSRTLDVITCTSTLDRRRCALRTDGFLTVSRLRTASCSTCTSGELLSGPGVVFEQANIRVVLCTRFVTFHKHQFLLWHDVGEGERTRTLRASLPFWHCIVEVGVCKQQPVAPRNVQAVMDCYGKEALFAHRLGPLPQPTAFSCVLKRSSKKS